MSIFSAPFGLLEYLFVPSYWNPPSVFNLTARYGVDIESFIFMFAVGGLAAVLYQAVYGGTLKEMSQREQHSKIHWMHPFGLAVPGIVAIAFFAISDVNPIYYGGAAMFLGAIVAALCRPDLRKKIWIGGLIFLAIYFVYFLLLNLIYPGFVQEVWNFTHISGIMILGVPVEELLYAFTFGMLWSSIYEHLWWLKLVKPRNR